MSDLAKRVRVARLQAGMSARAVDRAAGLGEGHTALIEADVRKHITVQTATRLARALGVSIEWLLGEVGTDDDEDEHTGVHVRPDADPEQTGVHKTGTDGDGE